jgi:O-antigen/teichoic acid export membrane protein
MRLLDDPEFRKRYVPGLVGILLGITFSVAVLSMTWFSPWEIFGIASVSITIALGAVWYWGLRYQRQGWPRMGPPASHAQRGGEIVCGVANVVCFLLAAYLIGVGKVRVALGLLTVGSIAGIALLILLKRRHKT